MRGKRGEHLANELQKLEELSTSRIKPPIPTVNRDKTTTVSMTNGRISRKLPVSVTWISISWFTQPDFFTRFRSVHLLRP